MAVLFALLSFIGWGTGDVFVARASKKLGGNATLFLGFLFAFIYSTLLLPFVGPIRSFSMLGIAFLIQILHTLANWSFFKGMQIGKATIVGALGSSFSVVTVILSIVLYGEHLTVMKGLGFLVIFVGIILLSLNFIEIKKHGMRHLLTDKGVPYGLATLLGWGIVFALLKIPSETIGWFWTGYPLTIITLFLILSQKIRAEVGHAVQKKNWFWLIIPFSILGTTADYSYNIGITKGFVSTVVPIAGASPVLFVILARIIFRERLTFQQKIGILFALAGIIVISFQG